MALKKEEAVITEVLKMIAPGTPIRDGLENILKAKTGALIVIGDTKEVLELVDGGFQLDVEYTSSRLYELAKMDGAIVLSSDLKKILYANTQIIPSSSIITTETGTRHRTAERTAKQTGALVISISQRRSIITIFKGNYRYVLEDTAKVISKANQALQTVEKYKKVFDNKLSLLNEYEFNDIVTLENVIVAIQRAEMVMKIVDEVQRGISELGQDGRLISMQLEELVGGLEREELLIIKDYLGKGTNKTEDEALEEIIALPYEELLKASSIAKILGYENFDNYDEVGVYTRGYRILTKIPRVPNNIVENLVKSENSLIVILDHITDPHNFGAIIRTCEAAGVDGIIIPKDRSVQVNSTVIKVSTGAIENVKISKVTNLVNTINYLKKNGYWIVGTDMNGTNYTKLDYKGKIALIIGNEGEGMGRLVKDSCDFIASIPMIGRTNSLNASVAAGILIYEVVKQNNAI